MQVVRNLNISKIEVRSEEDQDVVKYVKGKDIEKILVRPPETTAQVLDHYLPLFGPPMKRLQQKKLSWIVDPHKVC